MAIHQVVRLSSKGQLIVPAKIRKLMGLEKGSDLIMVVEGPNLLIMAITPPETKAFRDLLAKSFELLKKGGKEYRSLWRAIQSHSVARIYRNI